jgi:hypothetical protein
MKEAAYILGMNNYREGYKRFLWLSQSTFINKMLQQFCIDESKRGYLFILYEIHLLKNMCPKIYIKRDRIEKIPYALTIRFIIYVMLCTRLDVLYFEHNE